MKGPVLAGLLCTKLTSVTDFILRHRQMQAQDTQLRHKDAKGWGDHLPSGCSCFLTVLHLRAKESQSFVELRARGKGVPESFSVGGKVK